MSTPVQTFPLFQVAAKALLWEDDKILLLIHPNGGYDFPGGRMNDSELELSLEEILAREIAEELGDSIKFEVKEIAFVSKRQYVLNGQTHYVLAVYFNTKLTGGNIDLSEEHTDFSWIEPTSILSDKDKFLTKDEYEQYNKYFSGL